MSTRTTPDEVVQLTGSRAEPVWSDVTRLTDQDLHLFNEGTHHQLADRLGAHLSTVDGVVGTSFGVWAPDAKSVSVVGDFNGWDPALHHLVPRGSSGIWEGFIPGVTAGHRYKFHIVGRNDYTVDKADPYATHTETPPRTASVVWDLSYDWGDDQWMGTRAGANSLEAPMSVYEVHLGSWRRVPEEDSRSLTYRELAEQLPDYVASMGFTHVELLPVMEHPFYGSWGYQSTGYFAPTSRYGTPQDLMYLIDQLHQRGIGVILDWVPSHFPTDEFSLGYFDGTHLYEHADPSRGIHPDWNSYVFNYGRHEVRSFLLSSAMFWLSRYHADGLRVDAVASMLYLDYSRKAGQWTPNRYGGREDLDAIDFLRRFNADAYSTHPDTQTIAEESTAWPMVSRPTYVGGLGFGMKWDMGWMHDSLVYFTKDPIHRRFHQGTLTFRMIYAFTENFMLPLSHDEVTHGKGSLAGKMPGDDWQKLANLRALLGYMWTQPGKKLLFMGGEFAQWREWNHDESLDWHLLEEAQHAGVQRWVRDLNRLLREEPALHQLDSSPDGFEWVDASDAGASVLNYLRKDRNDRPVLVVLNLTPVPREGYGVGVPQGGYWRELLNSDAVAYGGSGIGNLGGVQADEEEVHGRPWSLKLALPPLGVVVFRPDVG
jgi:1,4-alpha-glucan branching enzyme